MKEPFKEINRIFSADLYIDLVRDSVTIIGVGLLLHTHNLSIDIYTINIFHILP